MSRFIAAIGILVYYIAACQCKKLPHGSIPIRYAPNFSRKAPVNASLLWKKTVKGLSITSSEQLAPFFQYPFLLPEVSLRSGLGYMGLPIRLRKFVEDLMSGTKPLKIGVVGGSISTGFEASMIGKTDWFSIVTNWLASLTQAQVTKRNGCLNATPSSYMVFCLDNSVDPDVDLVFIEYSLNDGVDLNVENNSIVLGMEQLIRRLMKLPGKPAVVLVQVPHVWSAVVHPFYYTMEDLEGALSMYYAVPSVSVRTSMFMLNVHMPTQDWLWNQSYFGHHPLDRGHKGMADLVVHLIQEVALGLITSPVSAEERQWRELPLPSPMYPDNTEPLVASCLVLDGLQSMVVSKNGFAWVDDGTPQKPKWGFVSKEPSSNIVFRLDTPNGGGAASLACAKNSNRTFQVLVQFLKSYVSMGRLKLDCLSGCQCAKTGDAHIEFRVSVTGLLPVSVTWQDMAQPCDMRVTVLDETTSGGHKIRISGIVFATTNNLMSAIEVEHWQV